MTDATQDAISVSHLTVSYEKEPILWDLTFQVPKGVLVAVLGPNGAGKSTLIESLIGLLKPLSGSARFLGESVKQMRKSIAYVPQRSSIDWDFPMTALDLVLMGRYHHFNFLKWPRKIDRVKAFEMLKTVGMESYAKTQIGRLSGGQRQRLLIARALLQEGLIYLLDEPFTGVDIRTEELFVNLFKKLRDEGKTVIVVHHDLSTVESYFDWALLLNIRLIGCGPLKSILTEENLMRTYGKKEGPLEEVLKRSQGVQGGEV